MSDLKRIRREISARLDKALREGRIEEELRRMDRTARRVLREARARARGKAASARGRRR